MKTQPAPLMDVYFRDIRDGTTDQPLLQVMGVTCYPKKRYADRRKYRPVCVRTYYRVQTLCEVAKSLHQPIENYPDFNSKLIVLSYDGVPESKSGGVSSSLDVVCLRFHGCATIFPLVIIRVTDKTYKKSSHAVFGPIVEEIASLGLTVEFIVADAPARAFARGQKNHAGYLSCDLCVASGRKFAKRRIPSELNPDNATTGVHFPHYHGQTFPLRTMEGLLLIMDHLDEWTKTEDQRCCGYTGRSPFLQLPGFNVIEDIPVDYMHLVALGVVKKLFFLTTKTRRTFRGRLGGVRQKVCASLELQRVPKCFPRRARMDFTHFKASEWRAFGIYFFPILVDALMDKEEMRPLRDLWLLMAFFTRAHLLPDKEFQSLEEMLRRKNESLEAIGIEFLKVLADTFGDKELGYNMHVYGQHLSTIRRRRPLHEASAFSFENAYGSILKNFTVGTSSIGKQALENMLVLANNGSHSCKRTVSFHPGSLRARATRDDLVQGKDGRFYELDIGSLDGNNCLARPLNLGMYRPRQCPTILPSFARVHVYEYRGYMDSPTVTLDVRKDIRTKAIMVVFETSKILINVPLETMTDC